MAGNTESNLRLQGIVGIFRVLFPSKFDFFLYVIGLVGIGLSKGVAFENSVLDGLVDAPFLLSWREFLFLFCFPYLVVCVRRKNQTKKESKIFVWPLTLIAASVLFANSFLVGIELEGLSKKGVVYGWPCVWLIEPDFLSGTRVLSGKSLLSNCLLFFYLTSIVLFLSRTVVDLASSKIQISIRKFFLFFTFLTISIIFFLRIHSSLAFEKAICQNLKIQGCTIGYRFRGPPLSSLLWERELQRPIFVGISECHVGTLALEEKLSQLRSLQFLRIDSSDPEQLYLSRKLSVKFPELEVIKI